MSPPVTAPAGRKKTLSHPKKANNMPRQPRTFKAFIVLCAIALSSPFTTPATQNAQAQQNRAVQNQMQNDPDTGSKKGWWSGLPREKKMLYTTTASAAAIAVWGLATWDYGSSSGFHTAHEGAFEENAKYGGADKMGHYFATYAISDMLTGLYKSYGYDTRKANNYGVLSAWAVQAFMEIGDATSESQGFSWEDTMMNTLGALTSILMARYPALDDKIDLRVEYIANVRIGGIFDDYSNQFYSIVLKLDGFDFIKNNFLKYLELSAGYYTRGYDTDEVKKRRSVFAGVSFNLSRFFYQKHYNKTGKVLEYLQLPYTVLKGSRDLD
ncbi:MAG: DUF2279 domain-containing protein [Deltaproteobacteria bacterium]|nr:MAG: DUF2279 domain-containing protein [Deltaproteobacteria bacterium]